MFEKRNGRPSLAEQIEIENQLWPYFESGYKPQRAADETGINVKTVRRYFKKWYAQYMSIQGPEFFKNCKLSKGRTVLELNKIILKLEKRSSQISSVKRYFKIHRKIKEKSV